MVSIVQGVAFFMDRPPQIRSTQGHSHSLSAWASYASLDVTKPSGVTLDNLSELGKNDTVDDTTEGQRISTSKICDCKSKNLFPGNETDSMLCVIAH